MTDSARGPSLHPRGPVALGWNERWFARQAASRTPLADAVLPRLTRAADYSVLWMGVAAVLAGTGGPRGRRAAGRGMGSVAIASLLANQVGKRLLPRPRPAPGLVPRVRRARRTPNSTSFPSGHSASAAAFATGAALEIPGLTLPLGLTAAAVCWSRVYTGVHYPADVLAGAALGIGSAAMLARVVPRSRVRPADVTQPAPVQLPERRTGHGVVIVVNHRAGPKGGRTHVDRLRTALPAAEIVEVAGGDLLGTLQEAAGRAEVLAVSGGDGSVNAAAAVALEHDLPLAVLPGGTLNHFAAELGLRSAADTVRAVQTGSAVRVRVGRVSGPDGLDQVFLNTASLGSYPEFVRIRRRWEGRLGKPVAAILAVRAAFRSYQPEDVVVDGVRRRVGLMFVGNGRYEPRGFAPQWRPSLNEGSLDFRLFDVRGLMPRARLVADLLLGRVTHNPDYVEQLTSRLSVRRREPGLLARDGEIGPAPADLTFTVDPRPLTVFRPHVLPGGRVPGTAGSRAVRSGEYRRWRES